jgi:hypothetical protein
MTGNRVTDDGTAAPARMRFTQRGGAGKWLIDLEGVLQKRRRVS